jgi:hypothetical protein
MAVTVRVLGGHYIKKMFSFMFYSIIVPVENMY